MDVVEAALLVAGGSNGYRKQTRLSGIPNCMRDALSGMKSLGNWLFTFGGRFKGAVFILDLVQPPYPVW